MKTSVAIVEDNAGICDELRHVLAEAGDLACAGVCRNLQTALRMVPPLAPNVIIMDIRLPDGSGIDGVGRLKRLLPDSEIVMYTVAEDAEQIYRALEAGASGYLLKSASPADLIRAVREVAQGGVPMTGEVARKVIQSFRRASGLPAQEPLTHREEQVLELLAKGSPAVEIAQALQISRETVNTHLKHIYGKLHVRSRVEAVIKYLE